MAFSAAEVLSSHSEWGGFWAGVAGSSTSGYTVLELDTDAEATGFRFLLMSREHGGPQCTFACLAEQRAGEHLRCEASARTSRE